MLWFCWSRLAFAMILVHMIDYPDWQVFLCITLMILSITWVAIYQPFKAFYRNAFAIANDVVLLYVFSEITCFVQPDVPIWEMRNKAQTMFYVLSALLVVQFVFYFYTAFALCYANRKKPMPIHDPIIPPTKQVIKRDPNMRAKIEAAIVAKKKQDIEDKKKSEEDAKKKAQEDEAKKADKDSKHSSSSGEYETDSDEDGSKKSDDNKAALIAGAAAVGVGAASLGAASALTSQNPTETQKSMAESSDESLDSAEVTDEEDEEDEEESEGEESGEDSESDFARTYQ
jgi:hypothetical protein